MPSYVLVPEARNDLREILAHIAEDSPDAAERVLDRFLEVFELLGRHPAAGHLRADLTTHPVRFFPVFSYLVVTMAESRPVEIVRVLGGAQDVGAILG